MTGSVHRVILVGVIAFVALLGAATLIVYWSRETAAASYEAQAAKWWATAAGGYDHFANQTLSLRADSSSRPTLCHNARVQIQNLNTISMKVEVPRDYTRFHSEFREAVDTNKRYYRQIVELCGTTGAIDSATLARLLALGEDVEGEYAEAYELMPGIGTEIEQGTYLQVNTRISDIFRPAPSPAQARPAAQPRRVTQQFRVASNVGILPQSQWRRLTEADLVGLSPWELNIARNEIYARHGRPFRKAIYRNYFRSQPWYVENPNYSDSQLSAVERYNAAFILQYQRRYGLMYILLW